MTVTVAIIGAGDRGQTYGRWLAAHPNLARLVAVAEPDEGRRGRVVAGQRGVREYDDWRDLLADGRVADAAVIATRDHDHAQPAIALARAGCHLLLEKPIAPTAQLCREVVTAVSGAGVLFAVCHVLRYTPFTDLVKSTIDSGVIGDVVNLQHLEPVGWWHAAHSYVRGSWAVEARSAPMLLAKACHDLDWIGYVTGRRIVRVASFGSLRHFRPSQRPAGAGERCLECTVEQACPYSSPRLYLEILRTSGPVWPVSVVTHGSTEADVLTALRHGPYGRCVYACDNDVVDNQVLALELEDGAAATVTVTAFSEPGHRRTQVFGTHGCLDGDGERLQVVDFRTGRRTVLTTDGHGGATAAGGHGGGDAGVMAAFIGAVATGDAGRIRSGPWESLHSHLAVFAAEEARRTGTVVAVPVV
jgi:predicted dehydrogenase